MRALAHGLHLNPFGVLGPHYSPEGRVIRAFLPGATKVEVLRRSDRAPLGSSSTPTRAVCSRELWASPRRTCFVSFGRMAFGTEDPYSLGLLLGDMDLFYSTRAAISNWKNLRRPSDDA